MVNFPTSLDNSSSLPNPSASSFTNSPSHAGLHGSENAAIIALETKLGITASTPSGNNLLVSTGTGTSAWSKAAPTGTILGTTDAQNVTNKAVSSSTWSGGTIDNAVVTVDAVSGHTASNTGTIYGVPVTAGVVQSANTVSGASLTATSVQNASLASGIQTSKLTNPYKFSAYLSTATNTGNAAFAKVPFNVEVFDTGSNYDNATNFRFTAPVSGFYQFNARIGTSGTPTILILALYKNGIEFSRGGDIRATAAQQGITYSELISLNATDYVEMFSFGNSAVALDVSLTTTCRFSGFLVSTL